MDFLKLIEGAVIGVVCCVLFCVSFLAFDVGFLAEHISKGTISDISFVPRHIQYMPCGKTSIVVTVPDKWLLKIDVDGASGSFGIAQLGGWERVGSTVGVKYSVGRFSPMAVIKAIRPE